MKFRKINKHMKTCRNWHRENKANSDRFFFTETLYSKSKILELLQSEEHTIVYIPRH